jgi:aryl-alcohol dehydrogenase-like predicted oxidoreductase
MAQITLAESLPQRSLGSRGPTVGALGYGAMGLSGLYGTADDAESILLIEKVLELGVNHIDTANVYGNGHNELLLGQALRGRRDDVVLATKTGAGDSDGLGRPELIKRSIDESLQRLGTDHVDLFYLHRVDPTTPIEDSVGAIADQVTAGKIGHIGLSEVSPSTLRRAHAVHPITVVQQEYSLFSRGVEAELLPAMRELGIGLVAYSPLGRGVLSGAIRSADDVENLDELRQRYPRFSPGALEHNLELVARLRERAEGLGVTAAALALAWVMAQGDDIVPIPGTRRLSNLAANVTAARMTLDPALVRELSEMFAPGVVAGERYSPAAAARIEL